MEDELVGAVVANGDLECMEAVARRRPLLEPGDVKQPAVAQIPEVVDEIVDPQRRYEGVG